MNIAIFLGVNSLKPLLGIRSNQASITSFFISKQLTLTAWHSHLKRQEIWNDSGESSHHERDWVIFAKQPVDDSSRVTQKVSPGGKFLALEQSDYYFHIFSRACIKLMVSALSRCHAVTPPLLASALCVTAEIGQRRRSVCFQYDPWRENSLRADITPHCDSRGADSGGNTHHPALPSPRYLPFPCGPPHTFTHRLVICMWIRTRTQTLPFKTTCNFHKALTKWQLL